MILFFLLFIILFILVVNVVFPQRIRLVVIDLACDTRLHFLQFFLSYVLRIYNAVNITYSYCLSYVDKDYSNKTTKVALTFTKQQRKWVNLHYPSRTKKVFLVKFLISDKGFIHDRNN